MALPTINVLISCLAGKYGNINFYVMKTWKEESACFYAFGIIKSKCLEFFYEYKNPNSQLLKSSGVEHISQFLIQALVWVGHLPKLIIFARNELKNSYLELH